MALVTTNRLFVSVVLLWAGDGCVWDKGGMIIGRGNQDNQRNTCPTAIL
jgi:hypothetical protein